MRRAGTGRKPPIAEQTVAIRGDYITLGQLLKVAGIISNGGFAREYLSETVIFVNGEPEQRRGRKLRPGDLVIPQGGERIRLAAVAKLVCPVCNWPELQLPVRDSGGEPSEEICPCCGTEFDAAALEERAIESRRSVWIASGMPWRCADIRRAPAGWNADAQLNSVRAQASTSAGERSL